MIKWLECYEYDQHNFNSKPFKFFKTYLCHSVMSLGKIFYGTFPSLVVLASSCKYHSYLHKAKILKYKNLTRQEYLGIFESRSE